MIEQLTDLTRKEIIMILATARVPAKPSVLRPVVRLAGLRLAGIDFFGLNLTAVDFSYSILRCCRFAYANVRCCDFNRADLEESDWNEAIVQAPFPDEDSCFNGANLSRSNWRSVIADGNMFENANFSGADLREANFSSCECWGAKFIGTQLEGSNWINAKLDDDAFSQAAHSKNVTIGKFVLDGQKPDPQIVNVGKKRRKNDVAASPR